MPQAPLILAIEPDRRQSSKIANLARNTLHADLEVVEGAQDAIALIDKRVPDLILTSLLLSPKDESVLSDKLRDLDAAGAHVQTLVIPVLASSGRDADAKGGLLSRFRRGRTNAATPEGCDPAVFGAQIAEYLERAAHERALRAASQVVEHVKIRDLESAAPSVATPSVSTTQGATDNRTDEWMRQVLLDRPVDPAPTESRPIDSPAIMALPAVDHAAPDAPIVVSSSWADPFGGPSTSTASVTPREVYVSPNLQHIVESAPVAPPPAITTVVHHDTEQTDQGDSVVAAPEIGDTAQALPAFDDAPAVVESAPPANRSLASEGSGETWSIVQNAYEQDDTSSRGVVDFDANVMAQVVSVAGTAANGQASQVQHTSEPAQAHDALFEPSNHDAPAAESWPGLLVVEPTSFSAPAFEVGTGEAAPVNLEVLSIQALGDDGWEELAFETPQMPAAADLPDERAEAVGTVADVDTLDPAGTVDPVAPISAVETTAPHATVDRVDPEDADRSGASEGRLDLDVVHTASEAAPVDTPTPELRAPAQEPVGSIDLGSFVSALEAAELAARESRGRAPLATALTNIADDTHVPPVPDEPEPPRQAVSIEPFILPVVPRPEPARIGWLAAPSAAERSAVDEFLEAVAEVTERPFAAILPTEDPALDAAPSDGTDSSGHDGDDATTASQPVFVAPPRDIETLRETVRQPISEPVRAEAIKTETLEAEPASADTVKAEPVSAEKRDAERRDKEDAWRAADRGTVTAWPALETPASPGDGDGELSGSANWPDSLEGFRNDLELLDVLASARRHTTAETSPADPIVEFIAALEESSQVATWEPPVSVGSVPAWPILEGTHAESTPPPPADAVAEFTDEWLVEPTDSTELTSRAQPAPVAETPPADAAQIAEAQPAAAQPLVELLQALQKDIHDLKSAPLPERPGAVGNAPTTQHERSARRSKKGRKRAARQEERPSAVAVQDEWGFFDPAQCGFSALLAKLDEMAAAKGEAPPRPR